MKILKTYTIVFLALISFGSCGPDAVEEVEFSDLFQNVADNVIVPRYSNFDNALSDLNLELNNFDPAELSSLEALQQKFITAYLSWQTVSAFEFGPAGEPSALLLSNINNFPTNLNIPAYIEMNYSCNYPFSIGILHKDASVPSYQKQPIITLFPTSTDTIDNWNKTYLFISDATNFYTSATEFDLYISVSNSQANEDIKIRLDNIKVIFRQWEIINYGLLT